MSFAFDYKKLEELFDGLKVHNTGNSANILPFLANRGTVIKGNFNKVLGEFVRSTTKIDVNLKKLENNDIVMMKEGHELSEFIAAEIDFKEDDIAKHDFIRFLNEHLFKQDEIKAIHPYIYNFLETPKDLKNDFSKYGKFLSDVFIGDEQELKKIFISKESDDILTKIVLSKIDDLKVNNQLKHKVRETYQSLLPNLVELFREDVLFLSRHKEYFLENFPLLTHYYMFMYTTQLIVQLDSFHQGDLKETKPMYFALDWESLTKRRKAASDLEGFKFVKEKAPNLFAHIHTVSQLSYNFLNETNMETGSINTVYSYKEIYEAVKAQGDPFESEFVDQLNIWIVKYMSWANKPLEEKPTGELDESLMLLFKCIKKGTNAGVREKYGHIVEHLGAKEFLKARGNIGHVFNVKHDFLLLLTAIIVKDQRLPLNTLFDEMEKRGISFDRYSKIEIIKLFNNHNILDKKSDSGDAQYVKPIL